MNMRKPLYGSHNHDRHGKDARRRSHWPQCLGRREKRYIKDAMKILIRLRENNIFHGDAHPKNFMVDSNGTLKIIDFGLSEKAITPLDFLFLKDRLYELSEKEPVLIDILQSMWPTQNS